MISDMDTNSECNPLCYGITFVVSTYVGIELIGNGVALIIKTIDSDIHTQTNN